VEWGGHGASHRSGKGGLLLCTYLGTFTSGRWYSVDFGALWLAEKITRYRRKNLISASWVGLEA
jgi:hypothetical protein